MLGRGLRALRERGAWWLLSLGAACALAALCSSADKISWSLGHPMPLAVGYDSLSCVFLLLVFLLGLTAYFCRFLSEVRPFLPLIGLGCLSLLSCSPLMLGLSVMGLLCLAGWHKRRQAGLMVVLSGLYGVEAWPAVGAPGVASYAYAALPVFAGLAVSPLLGLAAFARSYRQDFSGSVVEAMLLPLVGLYILLRVFAHIPGYHGAFLGGAVFLIFYGLLSTLWASLQVVCSRRMTCALAGFFTQVNSNAVALVGVMLLARVLDSPELAAFTVQALCVLLFTQITLFVPLVFLGRVVMAEAGTNLLGRMGGGAFFMRRLCMVFSLCALCAAGAVPLLGFSALWMRVQIFLYLSHSGGTALALGASLSLAVYGFAQALVLLGWLRLLAMVMAGRPRHPCAAGAMDRPWGDFYGVFPAFALAALVSLCPGLWTGLLRKAIALLGGAAVEGAWSDIWYIYAPEALWLPAEAVLLAAVLAVATYWVWSRLRGAARQARGLAIWHDGATLLPAQRPLGDPLMQLGVSSLQHSLRQRLALSLGEYKHLARWRRKRVALGRHLDTIQLRAVSYIRLYGLVCSISLVCGALLYLMGGLS